MKTIIITTSQGDLYLKFPDKLSEISFGDYVRLQSDTMTAFEVVAMLSSIDVDQLYDVTNYAEANALFHTHIALLKHAIETGEDIRLPKYVSVLQGRKRRRISLKNMAPTPTGAHIDIWEVIKSEFWAAYFLDGEEWSDNFRPSNEALSKIANIFLQGKLHQYSNKSNQQLADQLPANEVLAIAKHLFNNYPGFDNYQANSFLTWYRGYIARLKERGYEFLYRRWERKQLAKMNR